MNHLTDMPKSAVSFAAQLQIRDMSPDDAPGILAVLNPVVAAGRTVIDGPLTVEQERAFLENFLKIERGMFHVACAEDKILGFQCCEPAFPFTRAFNHVASIGTYVALDAHRRGVGTRLTEISLDKAQQAGFEKLFTYVLADNEPAVKFYLGLGFTVVGRAQRQAKIGARYCDELIIEKQII